MRLSIVLFLLTFLFVQKAMSSDIKIMTYNIRHGNPPAERETGVIDLPSIANVINAEQPDLVALQEVDRNTTRSKHVDQPQVLANLTGMYYYFAKAIDFQGGDYGVAVLSRYPIIETNSYAIPKVNGEERVMGVVAVMVNGKKIYFGSLHLDTDEQSRLQQADKVVEIAGSFTNPFIVAGDFNAQPNTETITKLKQGFSFGCTSCQYTFSSVNPSRTIDYVVFNSHTLTDYYVSDYRAINTQASDHLPLVATLSLRPDNVISWQFFNPTLNITSATTVINASYVNPLLSATGLALGSGLKFSASSAKSLITLANISTSSNADIKDTTAAINNNLYFTFSLSVGTENKLSLSNLNYKVRISAGGSKVWYWTYSLDGIKFHKIAEPIKLSGATPDAGAQQPEISLSRISALQNLTNTTVIFRLYVNGANLNSGTSALGRSDAVNEPALALGGIVEEITTTPVELVSFSAQKKYNGVALHWQTVTELNNDYFELIRYGKDANKAEVIAKIKGENRAASYAYTDRKALSGYNYYQLKQVDKDGKFALSKIINVKFDLAKSGFEMAVLDDKLILYLKEISTSKTCTVSINNMEGKSIYRQSVTVQQNQDKLELPVSLKSGVYVAVLNIAGENFAKKFIVP